MRGQLYVHILALRINHCGNPTVGLPSKSILYHLFEHRKAGLKNRNDHVTEISENTASPSPPAIKFKYEVLLCCFKSGKNVEYVSKEIGCNRMSIYVW